MRSRSIVPGVWLLLLSGCSLFPDTKREALFHNPFPQLYRVAVLPFYNQSSDPTVDQDRVGLAYFNELQRVPGFEVMPVGVVKRYLEVLPREPQTPEEFQQLAQSLGVDAVVVGSVTDYSPYYPPRMGLAVDWYAANPGFHPIPPGYGLPWGTDDEEDIPSADLFEAEFALAREQLKTQAPGVSSSVPEPSTHESEELEHSPARQPAEPTRDSQATRDPQVAEDEPVQVAIALQAPEELPEPEARPLLEAESAPVPPPELPLESARIPQTQERTGSAPEVRRPDTPGGASQLPADWPDPRGFIPPSPSAERPPLIPSHGPVLTHTRLYNGHDEEFTRKLSEYFYFRDDARFGGWQAYLQRSEDFIRFCCYLHVTEMLASRGGAGRTRLVLRWPIDRYER